MDECATWFEWFYHGVSHGLCCFTFDFSYQGEGGSALNQTDNGLPMVFTIENILMGNAFPKNKLLTKISGF